MQEARRIQTAVGEGKKAGAVKLGDMEILTGPYSRSTSQPLVDRLELSTVEVQGNLEVRGFNVGQPVPEIKGIPQVEKIREAIKAIDAKKNRELLARWDGYGCATYDQLQLMQAVVAARNNFHLVQATVDWIDKVEFRIDNIVAPFTDTLNVTKADHKKAVEDLNLGEWYVGRHPQVGVEFLDVTEHLWLHSSSITGALLMLRESYEAVGIVNPRFQEFELKEQKPRIAQAYGAADPGVKKVISVLNVGYHWGAFCVDVRTRKCFLFDPMHLPSNITTLKTAVRTVVEETLQLTDQLEYQEVTGCKQKDSSSCGLWCLVVLELLLFGADTKNWGDFWSDSLYEAVRYLRMRYLHKVLRLQGTLTAVEDVNA
ncbi:hypothetical protein V7S43_016433 [Phytophthora oleae]|uniref:Ubiquitin-like protease family profile domain-containing protein n=1 Tax=Phytophthora oleae TaxID=2107226 RepID=A0ABD3F034_9STRA